MLGDIKLQGPRGSKSQGGVVVLIVRGPPLPSPKLPEREFFIDNLLVRIHLPLALVPPVTPHGGVRRFRWGWIPGCCVTKFALQKALKSIARDKLTFDERVVLHRAALPSTLRPPPPPRVNPSLASSSTRSVMRRDVLARGGSPNRLTGYHESLYRIRESSAPGGARGR